MPPAVPESGCYRGHSRAAGGGETNLREVISSPLGWGPPYVVQLLGEYVIEIHHFVQESIGYLKHETYSRFMEENPAFIGLTRQRAISYWTATSGPRVWLSVTTWLTKFWRVLMSGITPWPTLARRR